MPETLDILLLAPEGSDVLAVGRVLEEAGLPARLREVRTRAGLRDALALPPDLVLGDPELDGMDLAALFDLLRAAAPGVPFVACAPNLDHERGTRAVRAGAFDYCLEDGLGRLPSVVLRALREREREQERAVPGVSPLIGGHKAMRHELFRNSPEAIAILDGSECVVDVNPAFEAMFGYAPDEARGVRIDALIVPPDKLGEYRSVAARVYQGKITRFESLRRGKSGRMVRVSAIGIPVELADGSLGVYAVYSDVTARMRALDALRRAESNYRNFFLNAVEGMYVSTPLGRFVLANPALAELLGYDAPADLTDGVRSIGREIYVDPGHRERFLGAMRESDVVRDLPARVRRRDGTELDVLENVRAVRDDDGDLLYFQGSMRPA